MVNPLNRLPLQGLRALEAVARLGSLRAAAADMGVTPGAVSQQVIQAERILGLPLFERRPSGMVPTPQGIESLRLLQRGFADLTAAVTRVSEPSRDRLVVSVAPVLAARWLIWRLPRFRTAHPGIKLQLEADVVLVDPSAGDVDLCVRVGRGSWPGVRAERVGPQVIFPVCSREMAGRLRDHAHLADVPVIRETRADFGWSDWLGPEGRPEVVPGDGPWFSDSMLCLDAAISGEGVFLAFDTVAADALAANRLIEPFKGRHATANAYWFVTAPAQPPSRASRAFMNWLRDEMASAGLGQTRAAN